MLTNIRRLIQKDIVLPATVTVYNHNDGTALTKALPCFINNINKNGACILLEKIMEGSFHIFHSTRENKNFFLALSITVPADDKQVTLNAVPISFDLFQEGQHRKFKIGVKYLPLADPQQKKDLQTILAL